MTEAGRRPDHSSEELRSDPRVDSAKLSTLDPVQNRLLNDALDSLAAASDLILAMKESPFVRLQKSEEMTALPGELQNLASDAFQAPGWRGLPRQCRDENLLQLIQDLEDGVEVEVFLRLEVSVDGPLPDPGLGGDVIDQDVMKLFGREDAPGGLQDGLLFRYRLDARHGISTLTGQFQYHIRISVAEVSGETRAERKTRKEPPMFGVSDASRFVAGLILVLVPTVEIGGAFLLWMISRRIPGYMDNPVRQALFRAGHAHAGVLVILALVGILYVDRTALSEPTKALIRWLLFAAPILVSAGFFLSVIKPSAQKPSGAIGLTFIGAACLAVGVLVLGVALL